MTKTSTLSWPSEPTKVILRWVEQNKGPQGPLRQQYDTILPDLLDQLLRLGNEFPGFDKQPEESRKSKTQAKLRSLWTTYQLPVYKKKKTATWNTAFFEEGLAALDQSQLGPDFRDLFASALQNGADDENAAASETSSHNQPTRKRRLDGDQEQTDGPNRSHSAKHQRLTAHVAGTEEIPTGDDLTAPENGAQGRTNSAFFSASQDQQARSKPLPNDAATKKVLSNDASTKKDLSEDADTIILMNDIRNRIEEAVNAYLKGDLLASAHIVRAGAGVPEWAQPTPRAYAMQTLRKRSTSARYRRFVQSLVSCAVWQWCFLEELNEDEFFKGPGMAAAEAVFTDYFPDPVVKARMKLNVIEQYVNKSIIPDIPPKARILARRMLGYVESLLPRKSTLLHNKSTAGVISVPGDDEESKDLDEQALISIEESPARVIFLEHLVGIFEKAMTWNAGIRKKPFERHVFTFPTFGKSYQTKQMQEQNKAKSENKAGTTIFCLMPVVQKSYRDNLLGDFGPSTMICPGTVIGV